ncbi:lariat debranching enzyme [Microbotryomycetes sp. JL201]|nr:lariat debranching enzyme [Microbotryomycetes sp. JL201]
MRVAVVGCSHGSLDSIYASVQECDRVGRERGEAPVELVLCCGDFQAMRSPPDLHMMACPPKFRSMGDFHQYYAGTKRAPYLTIVIGGNHESSGFLWECFHGGWLAPDIYFLGYAGCLLVDGWLRIAGASGIWKQHDFTKGHFETVPYDNSTIRSVYHIRQYEVARLLQASLELLKNHGPRVDVFLSHDWPLGIEQHGDTAGLIREKPFFKQEIEENRLGSPPLHALMTTLQPRFWFSAHLHVKFAALFHHDGRKTLVKQRRRRQQMTGAADVERANPDEIQLDDDDDEPEKGEGIQDAALQGNPEEIALDDEESMDQIQSEEKGCTNCGGSAGTDGHLSGSGTIDDASNDFKTSLFGTTSDAAITTKFLALNKPGFGRDFVQIVDVVKKQQDDVAEQSLDPNHADRHKDQEQERPRLYFDPHWLAIVRAFSPYLSLDVRPKPFPDVSRHEQLVADALDWVRAHVGSNGDGKVEVDQIQQFAKTAPAPGEGYDHMMPSWYTNPQTEAFCKLVGIENQINPVPQEYKLAQQQELARLKQEALKMVFDDDDVRDEETAVVSLDETKLVDEEPKGEAAGMTNPDELKIDDEDEEEA